MKEEIVVLIPTRKRPEDFKIFAESWRKTTECKSKVIVGIDSDDDSYEDLKLEYPEFIYEYGEQKPFLHILNDMALKYSKDYKFIGFMEDDCRFVSDGWETLFINKINEIGENGIVYCNDLINGKNLVGLPFMNSSIVRRLGYMAPPEIKCLWADYFWLFLGQNLNSLFYFEDLIIEHRHYSTNKRKKDDTSEIVDTYGKIDYHEFNKNYLKNNFLNDIEKLRG